MGKPQGATLLTAFAEQWVHAAPAAGLSSPPCSNTNTKTGRVETPAFLVWTQQRFRFLSEKEKLKKKKHSPVLDLFQAERLPCAGPAPRSCCAMEIAQHKPVSRGSFQQVKSEQGEAKPQVTHC